MSLVVPVRCPHHKPLELGYIRWHNEATLRYSQKYSQIRCAVCKLYYFPDELNEPDNPKSIKVIENHRRYLEEHPKAKDVLA